MVKICGIWFLENHLNLFHFYFTIRLLREVGTWTWHYLSRVILHISLPFTTVGTLDRSFFVGLWNAPLSTMILDTSHILLQITTCTVSEALLPHIPQSKQRHKMPSFDKRACWIWCCRRALWTIRENAFLKTTEQTSQSKQLHFSPASNAESRQWCFLFIDILWKPWWFSKCFSEYLRSRAFPHKQDTMQISHLTDPTTSSSSDQISVWNEYLELPLPFFLLVIESVLLYLYVADLESQHITSEHCPVNEA